VNRVTRRQLLSLGLVAAALVCVMVVAIRSIPRDAGHIQQPNSEWRPFLL